MKSHIRNRCVVNNEIVKVAVWSKARNDWSPVNTAHRGKSETEVMKGTCQRAEKGDTLVVSKKVDGVCQIRLYTVVSLPKEANEIGDVEIEKCDEDVRRLMKSISNNLWKWLESLDTLSDGFIPSGVGWDGSLTLYDIGKRDSIRNLLYGVREEELVNDLIDAGQISSFNKTPLNWSLATTLPQTEPCVIPWECDKKSNRLFVIWWDNLNHPSVITLYDDDFDYKSPPSFEVPKTAIKVMIGEFNDGYDPNRQIVSWGLYTR